MRIKAILPVLVFISISPAFGQKLHKKLIQITVIDKLINKPVSDAKVTLTSIYDARFVSKELKQTDTSGICTFSIAFNNKTDYAISAEKQGYLGYLENDPVKISKSDVVINKNSDENIVLYLTSDPMHQVEFWRKTEKRYEIGELVKLMKTGRYRGGFPLLYWKDIPQLLSIAGDKTIISNYPANPLSSSISKAPIGMVALWFIESIRKAENNPMILPYEKYPSLNPVIHRRGSQDDPGGDTVPVDKIAGIYRQWWESVKNTNPAKACTIDPLVDTDFTW